ncbi:hypothetical protein TSAR_001819, partial [Trichomalopsis sarcophagae]
VVLTGIPQRTSAILASAFPLSLSRRAGLQSISRYKRINSYIQLNGTTNSTRVARTVTLGHSDAYMPTTSSPLSATITDTCIFTLAHDTHSFVSQLRTGLSKSAWIYLRVHTRRRENKRINKHSACTGAPFVLALARRTRCSDLVVCSLYSAPMMRGDDVILTSVSRHQRLRYQRRSNGPAIDTDA